MKTHNTVIVIATYNERDSLESLCNAILRRCDELDILIVDDNSPDGTGMIADEIARRVPRVNVLHRPSKIGLASALLCGFRHALSEGYETFLNMDADFSHDPMSIPEFLHAIQSADLVVGSRYLGKAATSNWSAFRLLLSRSAGEYVRIVAGLPLTDPTSGFRCFSRSALSAIVDDGVESVGYAFHIEMAFKCWKQGLTIQEIPIHYAARTQGNSKMSFSIIREAAGLVLKLGFRDGIDLNPLPQNIA